MKTLLLITSIFMGTLFCQAAEAIDKKSKPEQNLNLVQRNLLFARNLKHTNAQFQKTSPENRLLSGNLFFDHAENKKVEFIPKLYSEKTGLQAYVYSVVDIFSTGYSLWNSHPASYSKSNKNLNDPNVCLSLGKTKHGAGLKLTF